MGMNNLLILLGLATGAGLAVQTVVNSRLRVALGDSPVWAAAVQTIIGLAALVMVGVLTRQPFAPVPGLTRQPWWIWTGGALGIFYVTVSIFLMPRLGAALTLATIVVGQLVMALVMDHYGLLGTAIVRASPVRIAGALLLVAGVALLRK